MRALTDDSTVVHDLSFVSDGGEPHRAEVTVMLMLLQDGWTEWQVQVHDRARSALQETLEPLILAQWMESLGLFASGLSP